MVFIAVTLFAQIWTWSSWSASPYFYSCQVYNICHKSAIVHSAATRFLCSAEKLVFQCEVWLISSKKRREPKKTYLPQWSRPFYIIWTHPISFKWAWGINRIYEVDKIEVNRTCSRSKFPPPAGLWRVHWKRFSSALEETIEIAQDAAAHQVAFDRNSKAIYCKWKFVISKEPGMCCRGPRGTYSRHNGYQVPVISCIEISNKESQRARENYNFGEKPLNPKVITVLCAYQMHVSMRSTNWERDSLLQHAYSSPHDGRTSYSFSGLFPFKLRGAEKAPCPSVPLSKGTRWHTYSIPWVVFCGYCCLAAVAILLLCA